MEPGERCEGSGTARVRPSSDAAGPNVSCRHRNRRLGGTDFGSGEAQLRLVSVPARGTKECGQLDLDRVSLSPEPWLGGTPEREIVTIGPDRARRVTQ